MKWWLLSLLLTLAIAVHASDDNTDPKTRASVYGAFSRGDALSWDQLEVVAKDAGITGNQLLELKVRDHLLRLIQRYHVPLEVAGFSHGSSADEEFRVTQGAAPGSGALQLNSDFWENHAELAQNDAYLTYLLFRAQAFYDYRSRYDADHCTWIVREESEPLASSFGVLRAALNESATLEEGHAQPSERDLEFRRTLEPSQDPVRTLKKLIEFSLRCVAQKASDNWALLTYRERVGAVPAVVLERVQARDRTLASDFGRARFAMTLPERLAFHRALNTPFRYAASGKPSSPPENP